LSPLPRARTRALKDPGSVEYAWQTVSHLKLMFQLAELSVKDWEAAVADAERHKIYERIPPENPYGDIDSLLHAEVGLTKAQAERDVALRAEIAQPQPTLKEAMAGNKNAAKSVNSPDDIRAVSRGYGTDADYLTARIARDRPDILDRMKTGEYASVRCPCPLLGPPLVGIAHAAPFDRTPIRVKRRRRASRLIRGGRRVHKG